MNEVKSKRRLSLAGRQLTLAKIARREAMASLADAVKEEARSTFLAMRSRELLSEYNRRLNVTTGGSLRSNAGFIAKLQEVSSQADQACKDASDQAQWQVQTLAAADTRQTRFEERKASAQREMSSIREMREQISASSRKTGLGAETPAEPSTEMARKLQTTFTSADDT